MPVKFTTRQLTAAGQRTRRHIIASTRRLLTTRGYPQFSMRNIAVTAGLRLANVQYYFPSRESLIRALMEETGEYYRRGYERLPGLNRRNPLQYLRAVLEFNLRDISKPATLRYFTQLWALFSRLDNRQDGTLLDELYAIDLAQLGSVIATLNPSLRQREVRIRATLMAALIEGLLVVRGAYGVGAAGQRRLERRAMTAAIQLAYQGSDKGKWRATAGSRLGTAVRPRSRRGANATGSAR